MSNHEIETWLPPPEGGGGLHDQGNCCTASACVTRAGCASRFVEPRSWCTVRARTSTGIAGSCSAPLSGLRNLSASGRRCLCTSYPSSNRLPRRQGVSRRTLHSTARDLPLRRTRCSTTSRAAGCLGRARRSSTRATGRRAAGRGASARGRSTGATPPATCATARRRTRSTRTHRLRAPAAAVGSASRS